MRSQVSGSRVGRVRALDNLAKRRGRFFHIRGQATVVSIVSGTFQSVASLQHDEDEVSRLEINFNRYQSPDNERVARDRAGEPHQQHSSVQDAHIGDATDAHSGDTIDAHSGGAADALDFLEMLLRDVQSQVGQQQQQQQGHHVPSLNNDPSTPVPTASSPPVSIGSSPPVQTASSPPVSIASSPVSIVSSPPVLTALSTPVPKALSTSASTALSTPVPIAPSTYVPMVSSGKKRNVRSVNRRGSLQHGSSGGANTSIYTKNELQVDHSLDEPWVHGISPEEEQAYCHILQEAKRLHECRARLGRHLGHAPSMEQVALAAKAQGGAEYVTFIFQSAPKARKQLLLSYKAYIASQARKIMGPGHIQVYSQSGWKDMGGKGGGPSSVVQMDDIFLSGVQGLMQAAYRFNAATVASKAATATADDKSSYKGPGLRFITYAHFYIRKSMMTAIKEGAYNQVFIPRHTLDLKSKVTRAAEQLQTPSNGSSGQGAALIKAISDHLGISANAVDSVLKIQSSRVVGLAAEERDGDAYEDVQMVKEQARIQASSGVSLSMVDPDVGMHSGASDDKGIEQDAESVAGRLVAWQQLDKLLKSLLSEREVWVLMKTKGLSRTGGECVNTSALAGEAGVSRQALDKTLKNALNKLKKACADDIHVAALFHDLCSQLA